MAVVVDASLLVVLVSGDPRRPAVEARMRAWLEAGEELHAPELLPYEVASGLTRLVSGGVLPAERREETWRSAMAVPITYHPLRADGAQVAQIAPGLARKSAYDAAYLAPARRLAAPLWTFDGPLARHARERGYAVHLIA